ncbi:hypothetical protein ABBQ32_012771 [Trebouxia sp. C0010 RCD-2024]
MKTGATATQYDQAYHMRRDAMAAVLVAARRKIPLLKDCKWVLGGFSWAANAALEVSLRRRDIQGLLLLAPNWHRHTFTKFPLRQVHHPALVIVGAMDPQSLPFVEVLFNVKQACLFMAKDGSHRLDIRSKSIDIATILVALPTMARCCAK